MLTLWPRKEDDTCERKESQPKGTDKRLMGAVNGETDEFLEQVTSLAFRESSMYSPFLANWRRQPERFGYLASPGVCRQL